MSSAGGSGCDIAKIADPRHRIPFHAVAGTLLAFSLAVADCGNQPVATPQLVSSPPVAAAAPDLSGALKIDDPAGRIVSLKLDLGSGPSLNGFNFNGLGKGRLQVAIPVGWTAHVTCLNASSARHSCGVVEGAQIAQLAFKDAATASPQTGMAPGQSDAFTFVPDRAGSFRITCLVPGHLEAGMWASLEVTPGGTPSIAAV